MKLSDTMPVTGLPRTDYPAGQEVNFLFDRERERFRDTGGHPLYGEDDVSYRLNSRGYRCSEFDTVADIRVLAIGCSYVLGMGMPQSAIFPEIFAEKLRAIVAPKSVVVWNLGASGASNDYISRVLHLAVPQLDPHVVLINFTHLSRREYINVQNRYMNYLPTYDSPDQVLKDVSSHFAALSSPFDDQLNFLRNYKAIEYLLAGRQWLYSYIFLREIEQVADYLDLKHCVGPLQYLDKARDHQHPGPESHRQLAQLYWSKFLLLSGLGDPAGSAEAAG
jgi:hypothetical protein